MLLKARAKNEIKIAMVILGKVNETIWRIDMRTHSLKHVRIQLAFHNYCELQRAENKRPKSCNEHIYDGSSKCQRANQCGQPEGNRAAGPNRVYGFGIEQDIEAIGSSLRAYLVVYHLTVYVMHHFQVPERKTTGALDEVRLGGTRLRVREGQEKDIRKVDELSIDFENAGGGDKLRLDAMGGSTKRHERARKLHYKLLAIEKGFRQPTVSVFHVTR